jgi:hypothetical protein
MAGYYAVYLVLTLAIVVVCWVLALRHRRSRGGPTPAEATAERASLRNLPLYVAFLVCLAAFAILAPYCDRWGWSRHPPAVEHRRELLETVAKQLRCPPEALLVTPAGDTGADVTGCGGSTHLCWRRLTRSGPRSWMACE